MIFIIFLQIQWYEKRPMLEKRVISHAKYSSTLMDNGKQFTAESTIVVTPTKEMHNASFVCEVWNDAMMHARHARVRVEVRYPPSVSVDSLRPVVPKEGEKVLYQCLAESNPAVDRYQWYLDDVPIPGQFGHLYEVANVTRAHQFRQLKCTAENALGKADGVKTIEVQCKSITRMITYCRFLIYIVTFSDGPTFVTQPQALVAGNKMDFVTLRCAVDSNPPARYYWTKGDSFHKVGNLKILH